MTRTPRTALLLAIALVATACGGAPPSGAPPSAAGAASPPAAPPSLSLDDALDVLADAGIAVYDEPGDTTPVGEPADPVSPFALLRFQVQALVDDAGAGVGLPAALIDELAPMPPDTVPFSLVLAGYAATAVTPGGAAAQRLLAGQDLERPAELLFPALVVALFVGETTAAAAELSGTAATGDPLAGQVAAAGEILPVAGGLRPAAAGPCGTFSTYLARVIEAVKDAILSVVPKIPFLRAAIEWALTKGIGLVGDALKLVVENLPFLKALREGVALLALGITVATSIRTWGVAVSVDPPMAHYNVGPTITEVTVRATVDDGPGDVIPESVRECLTLIGVTDQVRGGAKGSTVEWRFVEGVQHTFTSEALERVLDDTGRATFRFTMADEPEANHVRGLMEYGSIRVRLTIHRQDVAALKARVDGFTKELVGDVLFGALTTHLGNPLDRLAKLLDITADGVASAGHHLEPPPTPSPSVSPTPSPPPTPDRKAAFCTRYRALLTWWQSPTYEELSREWAVYIVTAATDMRAFAPPDLVPWVDVVISAYGIYAMVDDPFNVPMAGPDAARLVEAALAMDAYCGVRRPEEYP